MPWLMGSTPIRRISRRALGRALGRSLALPLLLVAACRDAPRSAAADVPYVDARRLPPGRNALVPDIMLQAADRARVLGVDSAPVQMFVISDYQCSECRAWFDVTLPVIQAEYIKTGKARLTWAHYPLREHPDAVRAASASLCAGVHGKFWEASARLFAAQDRWGGATDANVLIDSLANAPGIDAFTFRNCTESGRMLRQVRLDIAWADTARVGAPPMLLVGARRVPGSASLTTLRAAIDSAIAEVGR